MSDWAATTVGEIAEIFDGPHATPKKVDSGPWFLSISSLNHGRLDLSDSAHLTKEDFQRWTRRVTPRFGDVLFSYETRLGEAALMPAGLQACLGRRMALLRPDPAKVDFRFLLYAYLGPQFQGLIQERAVRGATVDRIPLVDLPSWPIRLPTLPEQRVVAALLSALDDKITVNEQTSRTALDLALARYQLLVTNGGFWHPVSLADSAQWLSGGTPKTSEPSYWGGGLPWISALSLKSPWIDSSSRMLSELGTRNGTRIVPKDTIIFVVRGSSLDTEFRIGLTQREVAFGQDCKALRANAGINPAVLFIAIKSLSHEILGLVDQTGHGAGRLVTDLLSRVEVRLPAKSCSSKVSAILRPLADVGAKRQAENRALRELRGVLLPKLMAGEIRVRDAEKSVKDAT